MFAIASLKANQDPPETLPSAFLVSTWILNTNFNMPIEYQSRVKVLLANKVQICKKIFSIGDFTVTGIEEAMGFVWLTKQ